MTSAIIYAATTVSFFICGLPPDASPATATMLIQGASGSVQVVPLQFIEWEWDGERHKGSFWNPYGAQWAALRPEHAGVPLVFGDCGGTQNPTPTPRTIYTYKRGSLPDAGWYHGYLPTYMRNMQSPGKDWDLFWYDVVGESQVFIWRKPE